MTNLRLSILSFLAMTAVLYVAIAFSVYRFRHPELTDTELLLNVGSALTFQTTDRP